MNSPLCLIRYVCVTETQGALLYQEEHLHLDPIFWGRERESGIFFLLDQYWDHEMQFAILILEFKLCFVGSGSDVHKTTERDLQA